VTLLETTTGKVFATLQGDDLAVSAIAFSANGKTLAFATEGDCVYLWNFSKVQDGKCPTCRRTARENTKRPRFLGGES
jgi:WD40 repeat protein